MREHRAQIQRGEPLQRLSPFFRNGIATQTAETNIYSNNKEVKEHEQVRSGTAQERHYD